MTINHTVLWLQGIDVALIVLLPSITATRKAAYLSPCRSQTIFPTTNYYVFEDEHEAAKYCDLLQGGGQGCEGIAELEASSVFDICRTMRALAVLFRQRRTPPLLKSLEQNLRARKRSLEVK